MEITFNPTACRHLRWIVNTHLTRELTQEVRLPEGMGDIGRILGCWGQVLVRSKEWRGGNMGISGGVMVWVLYAPEDGSELQTVESWMPLQLKWDLPDTEQDGFILIYPMLKSMDARSTSARKIMVRANVGTWGAALNNGQTQLWDAPQQMPEDVQLLTQEYPMELPVEFGEKMVDFEERLELPSGYPPVERIIRYSLTPVNTEQRVMGSRIVFRGKALLQLLYWGGGKVNTWNTEISYAQFGDLDRDYGTHATADVIPLLTNLEIAMNEGQPELKGDMAVQYVIYDRHMIPMTEDAYSTLRPVEIHTQALEMPNRLDKTCQSLRIRQNMPCQAGNVLDAFLMLDTPKFRMGDGGGEVFLSGQTEVLYRDMEGNIQCENGKLEYCHAFHADEHTKMDILAMGEDRIDLSVDGNGITLEIPVRLDIGVTGNTAQTPISAITLGDEAKPDPSRPSLILRRCKDQTLWEIAKENGSTVDAIRRINSLENEPENGRMILIPIS